MDNIQKELIKAGRKDLAQEYYKKTAMPKSSFSKAIDLIEQSIKIAYERKENDISIKLSSAKSLLEDCQKLITSMIINVKESISTIEQQI